LGQKAFEQNLFEQKILGQKAFEQHFVKIFIKQTIAKIYISQLLFN
jgi:hypothetical protein